MLLESKVDTHMRKPQVRYKHDYIRRAQEIPFFNTGQ